VIQTRRIDPKTGSYVMTDGRWEMDDTGFSQIYLALYTKFGSVPADPTMGCRFWGETKIQANTTTTAKKQMKDAVQHLIDQGVIDSFEVVYLDKNRANPSRIDIGWTWKKGGQTHTYDGSLATGTD
jgi:phage gp46-like protein